MDWAVILAGGSGTRFWPLSSPSAPKQLLPLVGARSTAEETLDALDGFIPESRILVITGALLAPLLVKKLGLDPANVLIEPRAASTGPALVWATAEVLRRDPHPVILSLHADWSIGDTDAFVKTANTALFAARDHDRLITVGAVPTRPETGYGYIVPGEELGGGARTVARFVEKPDAGTAAELMAQGALWNTGLFAWSGQRLLAEVEKHTPEIAPHLIRLAENDPKAFFAGVTDISIDVGVLERSASVAVVPGRFEWDDVGTWEALARIRPKDAAGNVIVGPVTLHESTGCIGWSDGTPVVASGLRDAIIVAANGRVLVMSRANAPHLKRTLDVLPDEIRRLP